MYLAAASFLTYFGLAAYSHFSGPGRFGVNLNIAGEKVTLNRILPDTPASRAGLQVGDRLLAAGGRPMRTQIDWYVASAQVEAGRPVKLEIERNRQRLEVEVTLGSRWRGVSPARQVAAGLAWFGKLLTVALALFIAFRRPDDAMALMGAWLLAAVSVLVPGIPYGFAANWRALPAPLQGLAWLGLLGTLMVGAVLCTFFSLFPRRLFRARWPWVLIWAPAVSMLPVAYFIFRIVYQPAGELGFTEEHLDWVLEEHLDWVLYVQLLYFIIGFILLLVNFRRLKDVNERRRVRVVIVGLACFMGGPVWATQLPLATVVDFLIASASLLFPLSFGYAILRHRAFDIHVLIRQGLQYALARGVLVSALPALGLFLVFDVVWHADERVADVLSARGWVYAVMAFLAVVAHTQRQKWLEALDRRFFRERYDAQRLLREVVEEARRGRSFEAMAPRVVAKVEQALHPEFAALLVREPGQPHFPVLAAAPAGQAPPPVPAGSKLVALVRLLNKPLEVPQTESGWLQQQLPHEETDFLRRARIDLLVPIAIVPDRTEALLAVGPKRSEEPYTREDQDLLAAVATSLALLLEKPAAAPARVSEVFEECPRCGTCYDTGTGNCGQEGVALTVVPLPRLLAERYRLQRRLGRGGMGTVYAATDTALERPVAVKVIRDELVGNADAAERFRREARAAAGFTHPNVVTVHDFGVAARTRAFLVMELLRGAALREELQKEKRLAPARALEVLRGVCAAVEAAHRRQLIHRDLKPENIFLARDESGEVPKILDFGIAKFLPAATASTADTGGGLLVGTLHYMAPEQLRGESVSPGWDLWALAVVTYEMLTGARPFPDASAAEWQSAVLLGRFTPVADRLPEAPAPWQDFFAQTFAAQPDRRPSSAADFFSRLEQVLA